MKHLINILINILIKSTFILAAVCIVFMSASRAQEGYSQYTGSGTLGGSGTMVQERMVTGTTAGWRMVSTPFTSTAFSALGMVNIGAGNNNVLTLNTANSNAWVGLHTLGLTSSSAMGAGKGYLVYFGGTSPYTGVNGSTVATNLSFSGTPNTSNVSVTGLSDGSSATTYGWSVVGNPFASGITFSDLTRTNLDDAYYIWDATAGTWASYVNGTSSPSGKLTGIIPPMQGFLVKANAASPALTFPTSARTTATPNTQLRATSPFSQRMYLRVTDPANGRVDEAALLAHSQATTAFEGSYDAYKLNSWTAGALNLATRSSDGHLLSIQATGEWDTALWVPMQVQTTQNGTLTVEADLSDVDAGQPVWLEDLHLNVQHDLRLGAYTYAHMANVADRFRIHFRALVPVVVQLNGAVRYGTATGLPMAQAQLQIGSASQPVATTTSSPQGEFGFSAVPAGQYAITVLPAQGWGGVNATDAVLVARHFAGQQGLTGLAELAADVTGGGSVNATDALSILNRYTGQISSFPGLGGDFVWTPSSLVLGGQSSQSIGVAVLAKGDVNMSYVTGTGLRTTQPRLGERGALWLSEGEVEVPVFAASAMDPAAVSLEWLLPAGVRVLEVRPSMPSVAGFSMLQRGTVCRVAWYGAHAQSLREGDELCRIRVSGAVDGIWSLGSASELADERGMAYAEPALSMPRLLRSGQGGTPAGAGSSVTVSAYGGRVYVGGVSGPYSLELMDVRGRMVWSTTGSAEAFHTPVPALASGLYVARLVSGGENHLVKFRVNGGVQ